ncbi:hypothetical protein Pla52o_17110 [Novipirellula galeiformis]|uniref:Uncharacterized protein n=1 Tax=Novipirellula galeiformis TaxID=2528004 RepID=A0A5C6CLB6_9BACT|nr:hypothetical protein Pla52o_17110 [Novipirellula galeiformis]
MLGRKKPTGTAKPNRRHVAGLGLILGRPAIGRHAVFEGDFECDEVSPRPHIVRR